MKDTVVLFSGGIDSFISYHYLVSKGLGSPSSLYVDLRHRYASIEIIRSKKLIPTTMYHQLDLSPFEKDSAEIPMRNLYLAMVAANHGFNRICLTVQRDEMSIPDRTHKFFKEASGIISMLTERKVEVFTPFASMDKVEMVRWYVKQGLDVDQLKQTWACYYSDSAHCGNCPACFRRFVAFQLNGISEDWHGVVPDSPTAEQYEAAALSGKYSSERSRNILEALKECNV